jgi:hypothetical protein
VLSLHDAQRPHVNRQKALQLVRGVADWGERNAQTKIRPALRGATRGLWATTTPCAVQPRHNRLGGGAAIYTLLDVTWEQEVVRDVHAARRRGS